MSTFLDYPDKNEIKQYLEKMRNRKDQSLSILGRLQGFKEALESPVGVELLKELLGEHQKLMEIILKGKDADDTRLKIRFQVIEEIIDLFIKKINLYNVNIIKIKEATKESK